MIRLHEENTHEVTYEACPKCGAKRDTQGASGGHMPNCENSIRPKPRNYLAHPVTGYAEREGQHTT